MHLKPVPFVSTTLLVLLLAACAKPQTGIKHTPTPSPTVPIEVPTPVPTPQPTKTPLSTHTQGSLTHAPAPVLHAGWTSYTDAIYTSDLAFDHQGNLWAVGSGVIRVDPSSGTYTRYMVEHGLACNAVMSVAVAPDGALWFGACGISRFDGRAWTHTTQDGLTGHCSIRFAPNGELWALGCPYIGGKESRPGRLSRYDGQSWTPYREGGGPTSEYALFLITAPDGALWLGTRDTISRFDGRAWTHTTTDVPAGSGWPAWEAAVAPDGALWVVVDRGIARFDGQSWITYTKADGLASDYASAVAVAPDGTVWVGTQDSGVSRFDGQGWTCYTTDDGPASNRVESAAVAPDGSVWFSTFEGFSRFDGRSWTTYMIESILADNSIASLAIAPDGVLWVGTHGGLSRFDGQSWTTYREDGSVPTNYIVSIGLAPDGALWAGTGGGLRRFNGQAWMTFEAVLDTPHSIISTPDGTLWVATPGGIYRTSDGQAWIPCGGDHLADVLISSLALAPDGSLWIGTVGDGIIRSIPDSQETAAGAWTTYTTADGLAHDFVTCIAVAPDGSLWAGTPGYGVSHFDGQSWATYSQETGLPINDVHAIAVAADGVVWVGGVGGVSCFDGRSWATYTQADGLVGSNVEAIAIAGDGALWFGTWAGLSRLLPPATQDQYTPTPVSTTAATTMPVQALSMQITPEALTLSAGDSACVYVSSLANWDGNILPVWSVDGLPTGATAEFKGQTTGNPTSGCLQINTPCFLAEGEYPLGVTAAVPGTMWKAKVTLGIAACEEFKPGVYTKSMDELTLAIVAGKPDFMNGLTLPLRICCGSQPRKLKVTIESATSEAGTPLTTPPRFHLFYSLVQPAPDFIDAHNDESRNVERDYVTNSGWSLEETITPGLYLLVFEHDSYADLVNPREFKDIPKTVTYRLEMVDIP